MTFTYFLFLPSSLTLYIYSLWTEIAKQEHMHRCLFINEILEGIAWDLSLTVYSADHNIEESSSRPVLPDKKSLLAFILTCRAFCEPGLNVLWRSLDGIYPLACTFQSNVTLKIEKAPDGSREVMSMSYIASFL